MDAYSPREVLVISARIDEHEGIIGQHVIDMRGFHVALGIEIQKRKPAESDGALIEQSAGLAEIHVFRKLRNERFFFCADLSAVI